MNYIEIIKKSDSLALYVYLIYCNEKGYLPGKEEIANHFAWGQYKLKNAFKYLIDHKIIYYNFIKDEKGRFNSIELIFN